VVTEVLVQRICRTDLLGVSFHYQELTTIYGDTRWRIPNGSMKKERIVFYSEQKMLVLVSESRRVYVKVTEFLNCLTVKMYFKSSVTLINTLSYRLHAQSVTVIMARNSSVQSYICYHPRLGLGIGAMTQCLGTIRTRERLPVYFHFLYLLKYGPLLLQSFGIILAVFCGWFYECKPQNWALFWFSKLFLCVIKQLLYGHVHDVMTLLLFFLFAFIGYNPCFTN